jgi:hypothetical protein
MKDDLTATHLAKCAEMTKRSFDFFYHATRPGFLKGANIMDIGRIGIDAGLLDSNVTLLRNAFDEVHQEMTIHDKIKDDGIRADGTFGKSQTNLNNIAVSYICFRPTFSFIQRKLRQRFASTFPKTRTPDLTRSFQRQPRS